MFSSQDSPQQQNPGGKDQAQPTPEQLARAKRHMYILYGVMILFAVLPFIILLIRKQAD